ncbi:MAG: asparagine synthase (glutamine-hydrolyzing) [Candidatus Aureabacteria bacterium]|nr:asparagine synthase (glutamine-hydrolyzing) [Candidatus Auribacterota bacterium]
MCGIAGILNYCKATADERNSVSAMIRSLRHRGPDGEGYYQDDFLNLGHCRLKIIDLSEAGKQPMCNEDNTLWLTYNGEIYNYKELRTELISSGHRFRSQTDSEVILHAYEQWGTNCLSRFNGMWAFALWDSVNQVLFCSRDRFGIKPFYYCLNENQFIFASEMKAILPVLKKKPGLNEAVCKQFLITGKSETTPETCYQKILRLMPGHFLKIQKPFKEIPSPTQFWDLNRSNPPITGEKDPCRVFLELFSDAVRVRLNSDVPVGSCLSGGLDSSSIVCMINHLLKQSGFHPGQIGEKLKTFSACYDHPFCDERAYSRDIASCTNAEEFTIFPQGKNLLSSLKTMLDFHDEPFPSTSMFSQWNVMKLARENQVTVLLDGQGGDELLAGYLPYAFYYFLDLFHKKKVFQAAQEYFRFYPMLSERYSFFFLLKTLWNKIFQNRTPPPSFAAYFSFQEKYSTYGIHTDFRDMLEKDLLNNSIPDLLRYEDRSSMAFSIETRLPFLDFRLAEFIHTLPSNYLLKNGWTKWILRESMKSILPDAVRIRKTKLGFATPETIWLHENLLSIRELFSRTERKWGDFLLNRKKILNDIPSLTAPLSNNRVQAVTRWILFDLWLENFL